MMNTQQLIMNGLMDLIDAGIAILVPVAIHYVMTKTKKNKFEMYSTIAKSAVSATMASTGITEDTFKDEAAKKVAALTKGKVSADVAGHLIDAAVTEIKANVAQSVAVELATQDPVAAEAAPAVEATSMPMPQEAPAPAPQVVSAEATVYAAPVVEDVKTN